MFKLKRKNVFIWSLVLVLCFIGYMNYAINKYSLLETSADFQKYEENQLAQLESKNELEQSTKSDTSSQNPSQEEKMTVVDSSNRVDHIIAQTSNNIENTLSHDYTQEKNSYFIESRLNMNVEREKMVSMLNEMISNEKTDDENRKYANDEKLKLIQTMNQEKVIENLVKSKGFEDAVVFITNQSVNIIIESEELSETDVAKVLDVVMKETEFSPEDIKISNRF